MADCGSGSYGKYNYQEIVGILENSDEYYMQQAIAQAKVAFEENEIPVGAVIVVGNRVIAKSYNQVEKLQDVTAHAEMLAITSAQNYLGAKYLNECRMYVTLEPCVMCAGALFWSQIGQLFIGARDEERGFLRVEPSVIHPRTKISTGVLASESEMLIKDFFKRLRGNK